LTESVAHGHHCQGSGGGASASVPGLQSGGGGNGDKGSSNGFEDFFFLKWN